MSVRSPSLFLTLSLVPILRFEKVGATIDKFAANQHGFTGLYSPCVY